MLSYIWQIDCIVETITGSIFNNTVTTAICYCSLAYFLYIQTGGTYMVTR